jgi:hypothetical protein
LNIEGELVKNDFSFISVFQVNFFEFNLALLWPVWDLIDNIIRLFFLDHFGQEHASLSIYHEFLNKWMNID